MTMTLLPSSSDSSSFDRLHPAIQAWIREQGWDELRDVQDKAIHIILDSKNDVLISASTAAGKTEAAFLPILTKVADMPKDGLSVLCVSPLKALINDQFRRLDILCERMEIDVVRWHGDAPQLAKARTLKAPSGVALITPESIEALFLRRPGDALRLFKNLRFIVIDELHAFLQGPRGLHLANLLARVETMAKVRPRRVGLSATIGDLAHAARWLRPAHPSLVDIIASDADTPELKLQIRGYVEPAGRDGLDELEQDDGEPDALDRIADHAFNVLRGNNNLVFGGSRRTVEALADRLRRRSESANVPNEFFPHHGSLAKSLREELELRLKDGNLPTTAVATTTLELGIDIGSVKSVAIIGAPRSLGSLRQRVGRSGRRRGTPAVLRIYVKEPFVAPDSDPLDRLRLTTVRAVAATRLLIDRFIEPARSEPALYSVLIHQILSHIVERGGARADVLYPDLSGAGPFGSVSMQDFVLLLRSMATSETGLIEQAPDGTIMLGPNGERMTAGHDFYAVFQSNEEWRLVAAGRLLGSIPISNMLAKGGLVAFAGQRWRIIDVDDRSKVLSVELHRSAKLPRFDKLSIEPIHDRLAETMRSVLADTDMPSYVDHKALELLLEGRRAFVELGLADRPFVVSGKDTHIMTWRGSEKNDVLAILLRSAGLECEAHDVGVSVEDATPSEITAILSNTQRFPSPDELAQFVLDLRSAKYDQFVPEELLRRAWVNRAREACLSLPQECARLGTV